VGHLVGIPSRSCSPAAIKAVKCLVENAVTFHVTKPTFLGRDVRPRALENLAVTGLVLNMTLLLYTNFMLYAQCLHV
jgi:hypothetical protein